MGPTIDAPWAHGLVAVCSHFVLYQWIFIELEGSNFGPDYLITSGGIFECGSHRKGDPDSARDRAV